MVWQVTVGKAAALEHALALILRDVAREGDGETLDGRDPGVVVEAVRKHLKIRARNKPKASATGSTLTKPKKPNKPIRPVSDKRRKRMAARRDAVIPPATERVAEVGAESPEFRLFVSQLACAIELKVIPTGVDPCHLRTKRVNGDWLRGVAGDPVGNIFPAMRKHHTEQHTIGIDSFAHKHDRNLVEVCRVVGEGYLRGLDPEDLSALAIRAGGYEVVIFE